jgi:FAD/FMN-containing dehydrogenase/Fe-S oxidoreductase
MSASGVLLRIEPARFERQQRDDAPTGITGPEIHELEAELSRAIDGEVRFDAGSRALYATDGSNYRQVPIGVVVPRTIDDVVATIRLARKFNAPILSRGGGTSLAGQCCNVAVVLDYSKYLHRVLQIDADAKLATVEPGCVLDDLRTAAQKYGLTYGPDPSTHTHCTLGGMLGNNSCGSHSLLSRNAGLGLRTSDNTRELEILTYEGVRLRVGKTSPDELNAITSDSGARADIYRSLRALRDRYADEIRERYPKLPRRVSGYNLDELLPEHDFHVARAVVGSEATLVTILQATVHLVPWPPARSLLMLGYPEIFEACEHLMEILDFHPSALEGLDHLLYEWVKVRGDKPEAIKLLPAGRGYLMVEFGGETKAESDGKVRQCMEALKKSAHPPSMKLFDDPDEEELIWKVREGGLGSTAWVPGHADTWEGWEDSAVPPEHLSSYLREFKQLLDRYHYTTSLYGHFGQGCVHCRIPFDLYTSEGVATFRQFLNEAADLVVRHGGSLSGEHGDGQSKAELLPKMFGHELIQAFREFKAIWDPKNRMNPGKKVDPYPITSHLRLGPDYNPPQPRTHFAFPEDKHSFARAALRCVGVGECRREHNAVMCPSYKVTREEKHSTRGRARLLWEMLNGEVITDGWRSEEVKDALDLCLACKGCKGDCPVSVDMATYKAEFLSHYYEGRLRPRQAYAMGWIRRWASLASLAPRVANFFSQTPGLRDIAKFIAGVAPQRSLPPFATETFAAWFQRRARRTFSGPPVLLFADTFTNYFHPEIGKAATHVLEKAGFDVELPPTSLCCGRPLYDYGFLDEARRRLLDVLQRLAPQIEAETPIVVLEPSCLAVLRDEMLEMLPNNENAKRLAKQSFLLSEFLTRKFDGYQPPKVDRPAIMHAHCHHRSVMGFDAEEKLLKQMGIEVQVPEHSCCGMAGSFGFEPGDHYQLSMACGERHLLPAVRGAGDEMLLIADGFSCRTQIEQATGRRALHLAQVLALADADFALQSKREANMNDVHLPLTEIELIAVTRAALGLGAGLLASKYLTRGQRQWIGWTLVAIGAISTVPLRGDVMRRLRTKQGYDQTSLAMFSHS